MEKCAICGKLIDRVPHITCATCGSTICYDCYLRLDDKTNCPMCARRTKKVRIYMPADLLVKVATTLDGKSLEDKLNRCIEIGYNKLTTL